MKDLFVFLRPVPVKGKLRLGNNYDGGYVIYKNILAETDILVSYGVGWDTAFEEDFNQKTKKKVLMFDPTMYKKSALDKRKLRQMIYRLNFQNAYNYFRAANQWNRHMENLESKEIFFIKEGISNTTNGLYDTFLNHKMRFSFLNDQVLLKIDIEGAEYTILSDTNFYSELSNVNQIIIEFHNLKNQLHEFKRIVERLQREYAIIHIHCNNYSEGFTVYDFMNEGNKNIIFPDVLEVSFVRKNKIINSDLLEKDETYPITGLDFPNNPDKSDFSPSFF